jgi:hypothetical protein
MSVSIGSNTGGMEVDHCRLAANLSPVVCILVHRRVAGAISKEIKAGVLA